MGVGAFPMRLACEAFKRGLGHVRVFAQVVWGAFQPGLATIVRRIVDRHLRSNSEVEDHRYPRFIRLARWAVRRPFLAAAIVALPYLYVLTLAYAGWVLAIELATDADASVRDFWTINVGVLGVQATLVGLVFPLVIAFVGLFNQGRASFASRLTIYIQSSNAIFVGVSSLALCVAITIELPFASLMNDTGAAVTLLNVGWFAINSAALAYFVLKTIAFLHPERRAPIIRSYVANVTWPRELTDSVMSNRWANVVAYGYLPSGDESDPFSQNERARTWYSGLWDRGEPRVSRTLSRQMRLDDVRIAVLAPIIRSWVADAHLRDDGQLHDFVISVEPGREYRGNQVLARATLPLGLLTRIAIRASLTFRRAPSNDGSISGTSAVLSEMIADLIALIDTRQVDEFADQLSDVIAFHAFLYRLAQQSDEDFNFALLGVGGAFMGGSLSNDWARSYRDVGRRAVERLPDETGFFGHLIYAPCRIYDRVAGDVTPKALQSLLRMADGFAYRLMDWGAAEHRSEARAAADERKAFRLTRQAEPYDHAWRDLVAAWERLLQTIGTSPQWRERGNRDWSDLTRFSNNITAHLDATVKMAARAVWVGDELATSWTIDLLLHWSIQADRAWDTRGAYWRGRFEGLTLEALDGDWASIEALPLSQDGEPIAPSMVFGAIVRNAWRDYVVVLASLCLHWKISAGGPETALRGARMLLQDKPHDRGDASIGDGQGLSGADILISGLRITGSGERYAGGSYAGRVDQLLEGLGQLGEAPSVSMRVYSSGGGLSFEALPVAQAITIMATMTGPLAINGDLRRLLTEPADNALRRREAYLRRLLSALEDINQETHGSALASLAGEPDFDIRRNHARRLVEQSIEVLTGHRAQAIIDAQIDGARIAEVATAAGSQAFKPDQFPHNFFAEIESTTDVLDEFTLNMKGVSKGAYTDPPMAQAVSNEKDWWRDAVSSKAADVVWWDVVSKARFRDLAGQTPDEFWSAIRDGSARMRNAGLDPILVVANTSDPEWLADWRWSRREGGTAKPVDLVVTHDDVQVDAYQFTMNGTPVYEAEVTYGVAYLVPAQLFSRLRYHDFGGGGPVSMRFEPDTENPWSGSLAAIFQRNVELKNVEAYRIRWLDLPGVAEPSIKPHEPKRPRKRRRGGNRAASAE